MAIVATTEAPSGTNDGGGIDRYTILGLWLMGLFNNTSFVVMLAGAKSISEGGTAVVFLADIMPSMLVKLSAPYWFHRVHYKIRLYATACLFSASFCTVGFFAQNKYGVDGDQALNPRLVQVMELIGVCFTSLGSGMGEASLLAMSGLLDPQSTGISITAFSSGTGFAGVFGFLWNVALVDWAGLNFSTSLFLGNYLAFMYVFVYYSLLSRAVNERIASERMSLVSVAENHPDNESFGLTKTTTMEGSAKSPVSNDAKKKRNYGLTFAGKNFEEGAEEEEEGLFLRSGQKSSVVDDRDEKEEKEEKDEDDYDDATLERTNVVRQVTLWERAALVASLWPYMIPLFTVYWAEYALQSGPWTAIGFPITDVKARNKFYKSSNWTYQVGVLISRSSGTIFQASMMTLWIMPVLQVLNLIFFTWTAAEHAWYGWSLLIFCFVAGLLGGGVYVNGFNRINSDKPKHEVEFALASASVADSLGIVVGDFLGLFIQSCLYRRNGLDGAAAVCPLR